MKKTTEYQASFLSSASSHVSLSDEEDSLQYHYSRGKGSRITTTAVRWQRLFAFLGRRRPSKVFLLRQHLCLCLCLLLLQLCAHGGPRLGHLALEHARPVSIREAFLFARSKRCSMQQDHARSGQSLKVAVLNICKFSAAWLTILQSGYWRGRLTRNVHPIPAVLIPTPSGTTLVHAPSLQEQVQPCVDCDRLHE